MGCALPPNVKFENAEAMVDSVPESSPAAVRVQTAERERGAFTAPLSFCSLWTGVTRPGCLQGSQKAPCSSTASRSAMTFSGFASSVIELAPSMMSPPVSPKSSISPLT